MPDKMNLKLLYCEFQKYEVMTMSIVSGQPKEKMQLPGIKQQNTSNALFLSGIITSLYMNYFSRLQIGQKKIMVNSSMEIPISF